MDKQEAGTSGEKEPSLWQDLGLPEPEFEAGEGPPLSEEDRNALRAFLNNERQTEGEARRVNENLGRWRSWMKAATQLVLARRDERLEEGSPLTPEDFQTVEAYLRNELPDDKDEEVAQKIERWRSWRRASDEIQQQLGKRE